MTKQFNTTDGYSDTNSARSALPLERVTIAVQNAAVVAQFAVIDNPQLPPSAFTFNSDEKVGLFPGVWTFDPKDFNGFKLAGVQVRSAVPGASAIVTVHA